MGRLLDRLRGNGNAPTIRELAKDALEIGKEVATDKDKLNELQYKLAMIQAQSMLSGKGASITKITICGLVSLVVGTGAYMFLRIVDFLLTSGITPENLELVKILMGTYSDYAIPSVALIGLITGSYLTGTSFKRSNWSKNE